MITLFLVLGFVLLLTYIIKNKIVLRIDTFLEKVSKNMMMIMAYIVFVENKETEKLIVFVMY